jgi:hypothetical protein
MSWTGAAYLVPGDGWFRTAFVQTIGIVEGQLLRVSCNQESLIHTLDTTSCDYDVDLAELPGDRWHIDVHL